MYIIACDIGDIDHTLGDCFSELMMSAGSGTTPHGPATIFSATYDMPHISKPAMRSAFTDKFYNTEFGSFGEFCMVTKQINVNYLIENPDPDPDRPMDRIVYYVWNILGDCSIEMKVGAPIEQNYSLSDITIDDLGDDGTGPVLFTADQNVEISNVEVLPSLTAPPEWQVIIHDLEALARHQIRILPPFKANNGSKVHLAIDSDLLIIPPYPDPGGSY